MRRNIEAITAFTLECDGAYPEQPLAQSTTTSLTIYKDGRREIGCKFVEVSGGACNAVSYNPSDPERKYCVHLRTTDRTTNFVEAGDPNEDQLNIVTTSTGRHRVLKNVIEISGAEVLRLRQARNTPIEDFAPAVGLSTGSISRIERRTPVSVRESTALKLAQGLGVNVSDLLQISQRP